MSDHASHADAAAGTPMQASALGPGGDPPPRQVPGQATAQAHGGAEAQFAGGGYAAQRVASPLANQVPPAQPACEQQDPRGASAAQPPIQPQPGGPGPYSQAASGPQTRAYGGAAAGQNAATGGMGHAADMMSGLHPGAAFAPAAAAQGAGDAFAQQAAPPPQMHSVHAAAMPYAGLQGTPYPGPQQPFVPAGYAAVAPMAPPPPGHVPAMMAGYGMPPAPGYGVGYGHPIAMPAAPGVGYAGAEAGAAANPHAGAAPAGGSHAGPPPQAGMSQVVEALAGGGGLSSLTRLLSLEDTDFWKGALVGAAAVLLFTNDSVQDALFKTGARAKDAVQSGADKLKQAATDAADKPKS